MEIDMAESQDELMDGDWPAQRDEGRSQQRPQISTFPRDGFESLAWGWIHSLIAARGDQFLPIRLGFGNPCQT